MLTRPHRLSDFTHPGQRLLQRTSSPQSQEAIAIACKDLTPESVVTITTPRKTMVITRAIYGIARSTFAIMFPDQDYLLMLSFADTMTRTGDPRSRLLSILRLRMLLGLSPGRQLTSTGLCSLVMTLLAISLDYIILTSIYSRLI